MTNQKLYQTKQRCIHHYGFVANPKANLQQNFNNTIKNATRYETKHPTNCTYHNLCTINKIPLGTKQFLGLNLNFCLSANKIPNNIPSTIRRMAYNIRTHYYLKECSANPDTEYIKQIYVKNTNWNPPPAPINIENKITEFERALQIALSSKISKNKKVNFKNLSLPQQQTLKSLKNNANFTIKPTDKNLGPAILDTSSYVKQILKDHLLTKDYSQLLSEEVKHKMENLKTLLKNLLNTHKNSLSKPETLYFQRSLKLFHRLPVFYGLPKVHKSPMTLRPVVSTCGSLLSIFSTWLDFKMKELLPLVKSYLKNSSSVITDLKNLQLPQDALLFSADAVSMYTNIDSVTGIHSIKRLITANQDQLPTDFPKELFLNVLQLVMNNNIFQFGESFWLQLSGTAMGTPAACAYATISYGEFENSTILTAFAPNLLYYRRYIDDIFGIWLPPKTNKDTTWTSFKNTLNNWGSLKWTIENPSPKTTFLDLNLSIQNSRIVTTTFQKDLNLYLYIPPNSAHPPGCLKGLIHGELLRYWTQNPNNQDFQEILSKFITRLLDRGHTLNSITPILMQAARRIDQGAQNTTKSTNSDTLYIHWPYHPSGLQQKEIRQIYNTTLQPYLDYDHMQIAISRPKNIKDILTRSALKLPPDLCLESLIQQQKIDNNQDV